MAHRYREEVLNVELAKLLEEHGLPANPETIQANTRPDVLVSLEGLKLVLEGRDEKQRTALLSDARDRVANGVADLSIALAYPSGLKEAQSLKELGKKLQAATYRGAVFYYARGAIQCDEFTDASLGDLVEIVSNGFRLSIQNDVVREHVQQVESKLDDIVVDASQSTMFFESDAVIARLKQAMGIPEGGQEEKVEE